MSDTATTPSPAESTPAVTEEQSSKPTRKPKEGTMAAELDAIGKVSKILDAIENPRALIRLVTFINDFVHEKCEGGTTGNPA